MNICVFSPLFGGGYGTGYSIRKEVDELVKRGHKIFVVHSEKNITEYEIRGVKYVKFEYFKIPILSIFLLKRELDKIIRRIILFNKIDIFYVQSLEFGLIDKGLIYPSKIIYFARSTVKGVEKNKPREYWIDYIRRKLIVPILIYLEKRCMNFSCLILVKSQIMKKEIVDLYRLNGEKIEIVRGGIDREDFPEMSIEDIINFKKSLGLNTNEKVILFAGRLVPVKGVYFLIKAIPGLLKRQPNVRFKLLIVGKSMMSKYSKLINKLIDKLKLRPFIILAGYVPQNLMYQYFNICDVVVFPSTYEPFGMVSIQAMILNKPIISTNVVGSLEIIRDYKFLEVIRPYSVSDIESSLISMLSYENKDQGSNLSVILEEISWKSMVNRLECLFDFVLSHPK